MSDTALWARRLERQRRTRKEAETLLERKSHELYLANNALQQSYDAIAAANDYTDSGRAGLWLAQILHPAAITLDLKMPDMDGWSVLTALRADPLLAPIPVVVLTIMDDAHTRSTLGASGYLTKPIDPERLIMMLQPYTRSLLPAPVADDAADNLSAGQGQPSRGRGSV